MWRARILWFGVSNIWRYLRAFAFRWDSLFADGARRRAERAYFLTTLNQRAALKRIMALDPQATTISPRSEFKAEWSLSSRRIKRWSYRFLPALVRHAWTCSDYQLLLLREFPKNVMRCLAWEQIFMHVLPQSQVRCVIEANDHSMEHRTLLHCCRRLGIKSIYLQHAAIGDRFPPLAFTHALLDGTDAQQKYARAGASATKVSLVGIAKFSGTQASINNKTQLARLGICMKINSSVEAAVRLAHTLAREFPDIQLHLRPHPRQAHDAVALVQKLSQSTSIHLSLPAAEDSAAFLGRVDAIVAGNSSILLDAAMLNVIPIYYCGMESAVPHRHRRGKYYCSPCYYGADNDDYYGFNAHGLCLTASSEEDVRRLVRELASSRPEFRSRAKPYCDSIGTPWDFRSDELAFAHIKRICAGQDY